MAIVYSVQNNKGGNSKSTTTVSLGSILGGRGKRVLIVDTDPQGNVSVIYGRDPDKLEFTLYDVLLENYPVEHVIVPLTENVDLVPSNSDLDFFDIDVISEREKFPNPYILLKEKLEPIQDKYDYIIIDTPSYMGLMILNVLMVTENVIIPFVPDALSVKGVIKLINKINEYKEKLHTSVQIAGLFPVIVEDRTVVHRDVINQMKEFCYLNDIKYIDIPIPKKIAYSTEVAYNARPAVDTNKEIRQIYTNILDELV